MSISEEFNDASGRLSRYDTYDSAVGFDIYKLKHRDIRSFVQNDITLPNTLFDFEFLTLAEVDLLTMDDMEGSTVIEQGENWTVGVVGPDAARGNFFTLAVTCSSNPTVTASVTDAIDLLNDFESNDFITIALPDFPATSLNLNTSVVRFGDGSSFKSVSFSQSIVALTDGDMEFKFARSLIEDVNFDLSKVVSVSFSLVPTAGTPVVRVMGIRLVSKDWDSPPFDQDTRRGLLRRSPPINGDHLAAYSYTQPILWRSGEVIGIDDPKPIDVEVGTIFNTGSISATNQFTIYFREATEDFLTQLDLDGLTMAELDGRPQPDVGAAMFNPRTQEELSVYNQDQLQGQLQTDLQRTIDSFSASWIELTCRWSAGGAFVTITNTEAGLVGAGYSFTIPALNLNQSYVFITSIEENTVRARIFELSNTEDITNEVFDSGSITDDFVFGRRQGRFGWHTDLRDGDAWIDSIRQRFISYGEYRSLALESRTPVIGAELFVTHSPDVEQYVSLLPGPWNTSARSTISRDKSRSTSGESWRIVSNGTAPLQGFQTNLFDLTDFRNTEASFDIYYPSDAVLAGSNPRAALIDERGQRIVPLLMPIILPDQWQRIRIKLSPSNTTLTGMYRIVIYQDETFPATWWLDKLSITARSIEWEGRAITDDPWNSNDAQWTPFKNVINRIGGGIVFPDRGAQLQIRGRSLRQDATINRVQFRPKYAELGRFVNSSEFLSDAPTASFSSSSLGPQLLRFTDTSVHTDGYPANSEWSFGDGGSAIGPVVDHQYGAAGVYTVTLVVTDNYDQTSIFSNTVAV